MNRHSNRTQKAAWAALATAAALCLALAPAASALDVADVRAGSGGLDFVPRVENGGFVLTVSGPDGFHHRAEFGPGESPGFSIFEQGGGVLPDGVYNYELTAVPSETQRRDAFEANQLQERSGGVEARTQSGAFSIVGGAVVAGGETEPGQSPAGAGPVLAPKDFVINDDLIVTLSACVGNDCVNGESFGFDTLRLKENNTRIRFFDTSVGSFPSVDWEIQANDSANGGQSWLRVNDLDNARSPFTIEANTPSHTLYVDSAKRIGIGTSTPVVQLHVKDGNTPALRLEQDNSSGFTAQTWDVAGNESNFFVRSATTGSQLPFRIRPGAPTSSIDISASGNVGINNSAPSEALHVKGSDGETELLVEETNGTASTRTMLRLLNNGGVRFEFDNTSGDDWVMTGAANFNFDYSGNPGLEMQIQNDGDLLILGSLLANNGADTFPDYVFADDYPLMSLDELGEFIAREKHLPKVPSAGEVAAAGSINMTELQLTLLEKVEELTLYALSLHERVEELTADRDAKDETLSILRDQLSRLEAGSGAE